MRQHSGYPAWSPGADLWQHSSCRGWMQRWPSRKSHSRQGPEDKRPAFLSSFCGPLLYTIFQAQLPLCLRYSCTSSSASSHAVYHSVCVLCSARCVALSSSQQGWAALSCRKCGRQSAIMQPVPESACWSDWLINHLAAFGRTKTTSRHDNQSCAQFQTGEGGRGWSDQRE